MKIAVVTGASSGMGRDFAIELDKKYQFDEIWLIARREDKLKELRKELKAKSRALAYDLTDDNSFVEYEKLLKENNAEVSYLVNASGYGKFGDSDEVSLSEQLGMIDLNIKALVKMTYITKPFMAEGSKILQLGSASTYNPLQHFSIYCSTKAFVKFYSRSIAREYKKDKITVTCVCPGWVKTEFFNRAEINEKSKNTFAKPAVDSISVVKKAIIDAEKGKDVSMYGLYNNFHHLLSKILPHSIMMRMWENKYKRSKK